MQNDDQATWQEFIKAADSAYIQKLGNSAIKVQLTLETPELRAMLAAAQELEGYAAEVSSVLELKENLDTCEEIIEEKDEHISEIEQEYAELEKEHAKLEEVFAGLEEEANALENQLKEVQRQLTEANYKLSEATTIPPLPAEVVA